MNSSLSSLQLDAFLETARSKNFSKAAQKLHITQSALSQRVLQLEERLGLPLFIREPSGIRLTELGENLLSYCKTRELLECDFLSKTQNTTTSLSGCMRVAGYSTVVRSVVLPSLKELFLQNELLQIDLCVQEVSTLPSYLRSGGTDFIIMNQIIERTELESLRLGIEENVLIESIHGSQDIYFDHDMHDNTTQQFFNLQHQKPNKIRRSFLDEIYSIIDAVSMGLGRAVVPRHLLKNIKTVKILENYRPLKQEVLLYYYKSSFYSPLQIAMRTALSQGGAIYLN